ncbi:DMT family transporter [Domibacillus epiphyticus]|uniref:EamA family transporter n=1 Tax=Domibacillus epiphyticus TaxID=1714355 RepID=A0A1V2ABN6_9BACI|nr:DMT family transporter [Domibacillus epiphyticus]OMP68406.1 EamA family transporter [Domibacillus epiphyticus]
MNKYIYALLVVVTTALMGSSFAVGKIGLSYFSPLLLIAFRFTIAGIVMAAAVKLMKRPHPKTVKQWVHMATIGFFQTAAVMGCIFLSLRTITSGESAILTFTNPLLVVVFGTLIFRTRYRLLQWIGVLLGLIGVFITMGGRLDVEIGTLLGFMSAVSWAIATLLIKTWGAPRLDTWVLTAYQMLFGGLFLFAGSFLLEDPFVEVNGASMFILLWLAFMASIVQFAGWFYLLQTGDPGKTSAFLFLAPFFGVLTGWLLLDEQLHLYVLTGGALIFIGIFLVNWQSRAVKTEK